MLKIIQMVVKKLVMVVETKKSHNRKVYRDRYGRYIVVDSTNNVCANNQYKISNNIDDHSYYSCRGYHSNACTNAWWIYDNTDSSQSNSN